MDFFLIIETEGSIVGELTQIKLQKEIIYENK